MANSEHLGHLGKRRALHLHRGGAVVVEQPRRASGESTKTSPVRIVPVTIRGSRPATGRESHANESLLNGNQQSASVSKAQVVGRAKERQVAGLVDLDPVVVEDAGVVLDQPIGDDDVADPERRVQVPPATPVNTTRRGCVASISSAATAAVATLPIPASTRTTWCPSRACRHAAIPVPSGIAGFGTSAALRAASSGSRAETMAMGPPRVHRAPAYRAVKGCAGAGRSCVPRGGSVP